MTTYTLLDDLMSEIPGADNYPGNIEDKTFGLVHYDVKQPNSYHTLRADRYHRFFNAQNPGVKKVNVQRRSYSDESVFMAHTTNPEVAPVSVSHCVYDANHKRVCHKDTARVTYAVPMEIVYMTPLLVWNPYDLQMKGWRDKTVEANGRNGGTTPNKAYNGLKPDIYYMAPQELFTGGEVNKDPADTAKGAVGVLDKHGRMRKVVASGNRIFLPNMPGLGVLRTRYPVMPAHQEGSAIWREMDALKEMVMNMHEYAKYFENPPNFSGTGSGSTAPQSNLPDSVRLQMSFTNKTPPGHHSHELFLSPENVRELTVLHKKVTVTSSTDQMHSHEVQVQYDPHTKRYSLTLCDGQAQCWDGHAKTLSVI